MNQKMQTESGLLAWTEPQIRELDVEETAVGAGVGGDAGTYNDCSKS